MAWPTDAVVTGDPVTSAQLNGLPVRIADTTLSASAASIDFQFIPGHYAHLMVVAYLRTDQAVTTSTITAQFNGDTGTNYDYQHVFGNGAAAAGGETFGTTSIFVGTTPGNLAAANLFGAHKIVVPHYANAANHKDLLSRFARKVGTASGNMVSSLIAGFWRSNVAVTRVTIFTGSANLVAGSRATLYGYP